MTPTLKIKIHLGILSFLASFLLAGSAFAYDNLDDLQLDNVVAGNQQGSNNNPIASIPVHAQGSYGKVDGEATVLPAISNQTSGSLLIQDGAQSHLNSMININAVNSPVQVLLNLNININSEVGSVKQSNFRPNLTW